MLDRHICNNPKYFASSQGLGHCQNLELEKQECPNNSKSLNSLRQISIEGHYSRDTTLTSPVITTSVHFVQHLGNSESLSAAVPVRELVEPIPQAEDSTTSAQAFGTKCSDSSTSADRNLLSGKMSLPPEDPSQDNNTQLWEQFSGALPRAGLMQNGRLFPQQNLERPTGVSEFLLLPTPMAHSRASDKYRTPGQDKLEQTLRSHGIIPKGQVSTPSLREWMMGLPSGYTDITEQDGGKPTHHPLQSAPLNEVSPIASAEYKPLATLALHSKQQSFGSGSDTWQGSCQAARRVWSKGTVTHHLESDEPTTHETPVLVDEATVTPEVAEELVGVSTDPKSEIGPQTIAQEVRDMVKSVDDTPTPAVEVVEELSQEEASDRHRLELKVERAFREAGLALAELRNRRLYRSTHKTWEAYCKDRFGYGRDAADLRIKAAAVVEEIERVPTNRRQILPTTLEQVRPLTKLAPDEQREVWQQAVEEAGGIPSGRIVKSIVERLKEKYHTPVTDSYNVGDIFWLTGLSGAERKYNNCWARAIAVNDFTLEVDVHDAVLLVTPDNLKPIDEPDARRQLPIILLRIKRLRNCGLLDRCAYTVLESLGRQTYLTPLEEKFLRVMEQEYGIND